MAKTTLTSCKNRYRRAKTIATKTKVMNLAMLNLSHEDQKKFIKWQTERGQ